MPQEDQLSPLFNLILFDVLVKGSMLEIKTYPLLTKKVRKSENVHIFIAALFALHMGFFFPQWNILSSAAQIEGFLWETKGAGACDFCREALLAALW